MNVVDLKIEDGELAKISETWADQSVVENDEVSYKGSVNLCDVFMDKMGTQLNLSCAASNVTTSDGFTLGMFRIRHEETQDGAPAVLIQHGLMSDSSTWIAHKNESLAVKVA